MPKIELYDISKQFGRITALKDVNITIEDGEYVVILGPSGCGKTTLLNIISGILKPTTGQVIIDGKDVTSLPLEERNLSFVFQNIALFPHMTVWENAGYSPLVKGLPPARQEEITKEALKLVDLLSASRQLPQNLSGGAQQKAALARALAVQAPLMILDEPLSALDPEVRASLRYMLRNLIKKLGLTAIHVTHDQDEAMSVADRIILMRKGQVVRMATPQEMYDRPESLFEGYFIGQANFLEGYVLSQDQEFVWIRLRQEKTLQVVKLDTFPPLEKGDLIVIFCRPENTILSKHQSKYSLKGKITRRVFLGSFYRYEIWTYSDDHLLVDAPLSQPILNVGETVYVKFKPRAVIVHEQPRYGLMEELRLE